MTFTTADLFDQHGEAVRSCEAQFRQFGGLPRFFGPVRTLKTLEDNAQVRTLLSTPGAGSVLVIDGAASLRSALVGDMIAASAVAHGWAGLVVFGAVRDTQALAQLPLGVKALGSNPRRSAKLGNGQIDVVLSFGGCEFRPGDWLYSDEDGVLVSSRRL